VKRTIVSGLDPATGQSLQVAVEDGVIVEIRPAIDRETVWLSSGLIDLQVNGYQGHDLNAGGTTPETVGALASALRRVGVTTFLPTIITASEAAMLASLRAVADARRRDPCLAHSVPFVHVEGPHLAPEDGPRGAHPREHVRPPDLAEFARWQDASGGLVGMVTLSPHWEGAPDYIRALTSAGILVAIGHTNATPEQIGAAVDAGATLSTHLGNGAAAMLPRHPNLLWTQLADDRLTATFIADGHHLPAETFRAMTRAKGLERSVLVSDAVALAGLAPGIYEQAIGGRVELTSDGRLGIVGTPYLAGAVRSLAEGVALAVIMGQLTLAEALQLATSNPGRFVGMRGSLRVGAAADLVRFRWQPGDRTLEVEQVFVAGQEVA
jgi:N-acetylglucosamine-6-phosphate deacetylase